MKNEEIERERHREREYTFYVIYPLVCWSTEYTVLSALLPRLLELLFQIKGVYSQLTLQWHRTVVSSFARNIFHGFIRFDVCLGDCSRERMLFECWFILETVGIGLDWLLFKSIPGAECPNWNLKIKCALFVFRCQGILLKKKIGFELQLRLLLISRETSTFALTNVIAVISCTDTREQESIVYKINRMKFKQCRKCAKMLENAT